MRRSPLSPRLSRLAWLLLAAACSTPAAAPGPRTAPEPRPVEVRDALTPPWTVVRRPGASTHTITVVAELRSRIDTVERVDTVRSETRLEWSRLAGRAPQRVSGLLLDHRVSLDTAPPASLPTLLLPVPFAGVEPAGPGTVHLERPDLAACDAAAAALQFVREVIVAVPEQLDRTTHWADSVAYTVCRDSIPLQVRVTRAYRVVGAERGASGAVVQLERRSVVRMTGDGTQFGEPLHLEAEGEGTMRLDLLVDGAFVVSGSGDQVLRMTMRGRRRSQELTQHSRITITRD